MSNELRGLQADAFEFLRVNRNRNDKTKKKDKPELLD